jgi:hypothetical protein
MPLHLTQGPSARNTRRFLPKCGTRNPAALPSPEWRGRPGPRPFREVPARKHRVLLRSRHALGIAATRSPGLRLRRSSRRWMPVRSKDRPPGPPTVSGISAAPRLGSGRSRRHSQSPGAGRPTRTRWAGRPKVSRMMAVVATARPRGLDTRRGLLQLGSNRLSVSPTHRACSRPKLVSGESARQP